MEVKQKVSPDINRDFIAFRMPPISFCGRKRGEGAPEKKPAEQKSSLEATQDFGTSRMPSILFSRMGGELASARMGSNPKLALDTA